MPPSGPAARSNRACSLPHTALRASFIAVRYHRPTAARGLRWPSPRRRRPGWCHERSRCVSARSAARRFAQASRDRNIGFALVARSNGPKPSASALPGLDVASLVPASAIHAWRWRPPAPVLGNRGPDHSSSLARRANIASSRPRPPSPGELVPAQAAKDEQTSSARGEEREIADRRGRCGG